jgi:MFS family permease
VAESGFFRLFQQKTGVLKSPITTMFKKHWRTLFIAGGIGLISQVANYVMIFTVGYSETLFHTHFSIVMWGLLFGVITAMFASLLGGFLAQTIGAKWAIVISGVLSAVWVFPEFILVNTQVTGLIWLSFIGAGLFCNISMGAIVSYFAAMFPTSVRYSGVGMSYQVATLVGSGLGSELAAFFLVIYGHLAWMAIGTMTVVYMIIAVIATLISKDKTLEDLSSVAGGSSRPSTGAK